MARRRSGLVASIGRAGRWLRWTLRIALIVLLLDLIYLAWVWPDWGALAKGPIPRSNFMTAYEAQRTAENWPRLKWQPVPLAQIPRHVQRAVIVAEDGRFYSHGGFDFIAIQEAWDYNWAHGRLAFGASTISQQTAKNLFLSRARTPWRKWHEVFFTWGLERNLKKRRILELYLNTAEFGRGVYGVEAAAQHYWGQSVSELGLSEAAQLAATLPAPTKHNPKTATRYFAKRTRKIMTLLTRESAPFGAPGPAVPAPERDIPLPLDEPNGDDEAAVPADPWTPPTDKPGVRAMPLTSAGIMPGLFA